MTNGILDQSEQRHRRTLQRVRCRLDVQRELQAIGDAHLHELQVRAHQVQLLAECRSHLVHARHRRAQIRDQALEHARCLRRTRIDQRLHVRERVEQEMRLDLRLQQAQASVQRLALELALLQLERERLVARERFALANHRADRDPRREQQRSHAQLRVAHLPQLVRVELRIAAGRDPVREQRGERNDDHDADQLQSPAREPVATAAAATARTART